MHSVYIMLMGKLYNKKILNKKTNILITSTTVSLRLTLYGE